MPLDSRLDDHRDLLTELSHSSKTIGEYEMGMHSSMSSFLMIFHHLPCCGILPHNHRGTPAANIGVATIPSTHPQGTIRNCTTEPNQLGIGMRACLNKNVAVASRKYHFPIHQTEKDRC